MSVTTPAAMEETAPVAETGSRGPSRLRALARQGAIAVLTLWVITFIAFASMNHSSVQIARNVLGHGASPQQVAAYASSHGLNRPLIAQYLDWLGHFIRGSWGNTLSNESVKTLVMPAFGHTIELALITLVWAVPVAIALGVAAARRRGPFDQILFVLMTVLAALPEFVIGLALMVGLAVQIQLLPVNSSAIGQGSFSDVLLAFVLPSMTLGIGVIAYIWRIARASVMESLGAAYTRAAVLRGLRRRRIVWRHAFRSASVPLVNAIAINIIYLMGGVIIVENVFAFPGLGRLLVSSIASGDSNTALAIITLLGAVFIGLGLLADLIVVNLDPRLKGGAR